MHSQVDTQLWDIPPPPSQLAHPHTSCPELGAWGENAGYGSDIHQVGGSSGSRSLEGMWGPRHWFLREKTEEGKRGQGVGVKTPPPLYPALLKPPASSALLPL